MSHTPGPWVATEFNDATNETDEFHIFIEPNVAVIEKKIEGHNQNDWDDARLIAAAPRLLKALRDLHQVVEFQLHPPKSNPIRIALNEAEAAMAEATGEQA